MLAKVLAVVAGFAAVGEAASAEQPRWLRLPRAGDMVRSYPQAAMVASVEGRATIQCQVTAKGLLTECLVVEEDPVGYGFGEGALRMQELFRMTPPKKEGGTIRVPVRFKLPADPPLSGGGMR